MFPPFMRLLRLRRKMPFSETRARPSCAALEILLLLSNSSVAAAKPCFLGSGLADLSLHWASTGSEQRQSLSSVVFLEGGGGPGGGEDVHVASRIEVHLKRFSENALREIKVFFFKKKIRLCLTRQGPTPPESPSGIRCRVRRRRSDQTPCTSSPETGATSRKTFSTLSTRSGGGPLHWWSRTGECCPNSS